MPDRPRPGSRWFPGYSVAGAAAVAYLATAPGQTFVLSQLNTPLRDAFGIGELALNASYALATVLASLPLVWVGAWADRVGPRRAMAGTALAFGAACLVMSRANGFVGVVVGFFLLRFLGQGALSMVSQHTTAMWFHRRLGTVHGVTQVAVSAVWVLLPPLTFQLVGSVGWRWTYVVFAGAVWVTVIPLALLVVRDRPEDLGLSLDDEVPGAAAASASFGEPGLSLGEALRTRAYWTIAGAVFLTPMIGTAFLFDIQPILATRGMDSAAAALAVSAWSGGTALMAIPAGRLTDRVRPGRLIPAGLSVIALAAVVLWWAPIPAAAVTAMVLFAVGQSIAGTASATTTARYFGRAHHGAIRSSLIRLGVIGTGCGPLVTGLSASRTDGYLASTLVFVGLCVPAVVSAFGLRPPRAPR